MVDERYKKWPKSLSASSVKMFTACHGAANLPAALPGWVDGTPKPGNAASIGDERHKVLAEIAGGSPSEVRAYERAIAYYLSLRDSRRFKVLVEETFEVSWLPSKPHTTVDVALYLNDELHVLDWKTGRIAVSPVNNEQLMYYAVTLAHLAPNAKGVWLHIVQPWAKDWEFATAAHYVTVQELEQFKQKVLAADAAISGGSLDLMPGDHCMFCPANPHSRGLKGSPSCPAMMDVLYPERVAARKNLLDETEWDVPE